VRPDPPEPADERRARQREIDPDLSAPTSARTGRSARPLVWVAISLGAILGTLARYGASRAIHVAPGSFPWSTFTVNVTGSFVLGVLLTLVIERWPPSQYVRPFAAIGFLGSYTTFSTWMVEADVLVKDGAPGIAAIYVATSLVVGVLAVYLGTVVARPRSV
jgi:fluoride exporter